MVRCRSLLLGASLLLAACSSGPEEEEAVGESADALRALQPAEKVGVLAFGETKTLAYTAVPTYRALLVHATAGDKLDAWVRGTAAGLDATAWIVSASSTTLATNNNASAGTLDAHVTYSVRTSGDYYVVLRDAHGKAGSFKVTLAPRAVIVASGNNSDGIKNGTETDIDCGGQSGKKCEPSKKCNVDADCTLACSDAKKCVEAASCKPHFGGDTCGTGEVGEAGAQHESCCRSLEVPAYADPAHPGKKVYLDKYEVTAGRVRAFVEAITKQYGKPDIQAWVAANPPALWNAAWSQFLASDTDGATIAQGNVGTNYAFGSALYVYVHGHNCYQGAGSYGFPTYYYPASVMTNENGGLARAASKEELDVKAMTCIPNAVLAAFCAWDGGQLATAAVLDSVTANGTRLAPLDPTVVNVSSDSASTSQVYYYPSFGPNVTHEGVSRIAAPGRVAADVVSINGSEPWKDLRGNLNEVALVDANGFTLLYQGIGYSSARAVNNPNALKLAEYKAGYSGGRCMRFR